MKFSAALLAGGRSTRMSQDKAFLDWHGRPLWRMQMEKLLSLNPGQLFIAARTEQDFAAQLLCGPMNAAVTCVNDPAGENCGPVGAIARCLRLSTGPLLVLAVDMPAMTSDFLRKHLLSSTTETKGAVNRSPRGYEALAAVYVPSVLPFFEASLAAGRFALQPLLAEIAQAGLCTVTDLQHENEALFANANTPDDAARLLRFVF